MLAGILPYCWLEFARCWLEIALLLARIRHCWLEIALSLTAFTGIVIKFGVIFGLLN